MKCVECVIKWKIIIFFLPCGVSCQLIRLPSISEPMLCVSYKTISDANVAVNKKFLTTLLNKKFHRCGLDGIFSQTYKPNFILEKLQNFSNEVLK